MNQIPEDWRTRPINVVAANVAAIVTSFGVIVIGWLIIGKAILFFTK
jgi:hypothetical protein